MPADKDILELSTETKEAVQLYVKYKIDYYKLHVVERIAKFSTFLLSGFIIVLLGMLILAFLSAAGALFIGELVGSYAAGMAIVAAVLCLPLILVYLLRGYIIRKRMIRLLIKELFS